MLRVRRARAHGEAVPEEEEGEGFALRCDEEPTLL
jgi:hypothetical protein